jgi:predicted Zn-dependent protease
MGAQGVLQLLGALAGARYGEGAANAAVQGGSILAQTGFLLPGARAQESEADVVGQQLMARAGFDPRAAVTLWQNMIAAGGSRPPQWLSTHPNPEARIRELQQRAASLTPIYEQARANGRRPACGSPQANVVRARRVGLSRRDAILLALRPPGPAPHPQRTSLSSRMFP